MSETIKELLRDYPVTLEIPVLWGDMDAFQHVNNLVYLKWFESSRVAYFEAMQAIDYMKAHQVGPILADTQCRYRIPLEYPDTITVGARVIDVGKDRFTMLYRVVSHRHQKVACEGEGTIVYVDYARGGKTAIPDLLLEQIARLEG